MLARNANMMDWVFFLGTILILVFFFKRVIEFLGQFPAELIP